MKLFYQKCCIKLAVSILKHRTVMLRELFQLVDLEHPSFLE